MKSSVYVVWIGQVPGIYYSWSSCENQVKGFKGARFKGFHSEQAAKEAYGRPWEEYIAINQKKVDISKINVERNIMNSETVAEALPNLTLEELNLAYGLGSEELPF